MTTQPDDDAPLDEEEEFVQEGRGRSANRREAKTFDALAMELVALSKNRCKGLPVSPRLMAGVVQARATVSKAAKRRHLRQLSGLLRDSELEVAAIQAYLAGEAYVPVRGDESYRDLATLREELCDPQTYADAIDAMCEKLPNIDLALVSSLSQTYHASQDDKSYRALYKELNRAQELLDEETEEA